MAEERIDEGVNSMTEQTAVADAAGENRMAAADTAGEGPAAARETENWRLNRDAAALARQRLQESASEAAAGNAFAAATGNDSETVAGNASAEASGSAFAAAAGNDPAGSASAGTAAAAANGADRTVNQEKTCEAPAAVPAADGEKKLSWKQRRQKEKEEAAARKEEQERLQREMQEAKERQKREEQEAKERQKREAQEEKERQKREAEQERQRKRQEKRDARAVVRKERRAEWKSLWHTAEFVMLAVFVILAIDQAGLYGFLFVWLFIAVMAASVALLLLGIVRAIRKKRAGIVFCIAILGIILCAAWFIFLVSSQGLGLGPVPN